MSDFQDDVDRRVQSFLEPLRVRQDLQRDLTSALARIERALALPEGDALRCHLLDRLLTCDAPRLRSHLTPDWLARLDEELS